MQKKNPEQIQDNLKVVLDTNILVSALISSKGTSAQVLSMVLKDKLQAYYHQEIFDEYETVLLRPKFKSDINAEQRQAILNHLKKRGLSCHITPSVFHMQDESDRVFYDVAKTAGAFLVTGNKKHYPDEPFIVTPRYFMDTVINSLFL